MSYAMMQGKAKHPWSKALPGRFGQPENGFEHREPWRMRRETSSWMRLSVHVICEITDRRMTLDHGDGRDFLSQIWRWLCHGCTRL